MHTLSHWHGSSIATQFVQTSLFLRADGDWENRVFRPHHCHLHRHKPANTRWWHLIGTLVQSGHLCFWPFAGHWCHRRNPNPRAWRVRFSYCANAHPNTQTGFPIRFLVLSGNGRPHRGWAWDWCAHRARWNGVCSPNHWPLSKHGHWIDHTAKPRHREICLCAAGCVHLKA